MAASAISSTQVNDALQNKLLEGNNPNNSVYQMKMGDQNYVKDGKYHSSIA